MEMKGKEISKASMVFAAIWIPLLSILKAFWPVLTVKEFGLTIGEIILSGIVVAAIFTPIYFSVILDKIKDIKVGTGA